VSCVERRPNRSIGAGGIKGRVRLRANFLMIKISMRLAARERFLDLVRGHGDVHAGALLLEQHEDA
jgi:hypothetical protein